ncbi:MAG: hypothetical protein Q9218_000134 [Villophora microphyllina]
MATFLRRPSSPPQPFRFTSTSPPGQYPTDVAQRRRSVRDSNLPITQHSTTEPRANGVNGYGNTNGSMLVPEGPSAFASNREAPHRPRMSMGAMSFNAARSPPNAKNTSHVPCKFFRLGQCQAGTTCPFSHAIDVSSVDTPCKYFAKGNCKFGAKCALAHILPNGRRVNRPNNPMGGSLNLGGRVDPQLYHAESALANSLLAQQTNGDPMNYDTSYPPLPETEYHAPPLGNYYKSNVPAGNGHSSHLEMKHGSPRDDGHLALPLVGHLSALDAPMPASFDSQGISYMARHGPVAASVPSKFGLESPSSSLPKQVGLPASALRNLQSSAFGQDSRNDLPNPGSSPVGSGDEGYSHRTLLSQRMAKSSTISASMPRVRANDEWADDLLFGGEEEFLPTSLHELLTPQERLRRLSRTEQDERAFRESLSGVGTPADSSSHVGSPSHASPSRFSAFFAKQKRDEQNAQTASASAFGPVGSPLRNSSLNLGRSPSIRATSNPARSGDISPYLASPPRQSSMSAISQQLARTRISSRTEVGANDSHSSNGLHPNSARTQNQPAPSIARSDRTTPSNIVNSTKIDEEQNEGVFSMEVEEETRKKRHSAGAWNDQQPAGLLQERGPSPQLGAIGTGRTHRAREAEKVSRAYWT